MSLRVWCVLITDLLGTPHLNIYNSQRSTAQTVNIIVCNFIYVCLCFPFSHTDIYIMAVPRIVSGGFFFQKCGPFRGILMPSTAHGASLDCAIGRCGQAVYSQLDSGRGH